MTSANDELTPNTSITINACPCTVAKVFAYATHYQLSNTKK